MAWIESHQSLREHPKTKKLARLLSIERRAAVGLLHYLWWWALDYAPDGNLSGHEPGDIAEAVDYTGAPDALLSALSGCGIGGGPGFLESANGALVIHDWEEYAGRLISRRKADAERKRDSRRRDVPQTSAGRPKDGVRTQPTQPTQPTCAPDPEPDPDLDSSETKNPVPPTASRPAKRKPRRKRACPECTESFAAFTEAAIDLWRQRYTKNAGPHWTDEQFRRLKDGFHKLHAKALGRWWAFISYEDFAGYKGHSPDQWYRHLDKWIPRDEHEKLEAPA